MALTGNDPCSAAPNLDADLRVMAAKQDLLVQSLTNGIAEVRDSISTLAKQLERHHSEYKTDLASIVNQTNDQESRLAVIESMTTAQEGRIREVEQKVQTHSNRVAQAGAVIVLLSLAGPVLMEHLLNSPPQTEVRPQ